MYMVAWSHGHDFSPWKVSFHETYEGALAFFNALRLHGTPLVYLTKGIFSSHAGQVHYEAPT